MVVGFGPGTAAAVAEKFGKTASLKPLRSKLSETG